MTKVIAKTILQNYLKFKQFENHSWSEMVQKFTTPTLKENAQSMSQITSREIEIIQQIFEELQPSKVNKSNKSKKIVRKDDG